MKRNNWLTSLILIVLVTTLCFSGCKFFSSTKLNPPVLTLNETDKIISWDADYNASKYVIYMNEEELSEIEASSDKTQYSYNYAEAIGEFGEFRFQVKSIGSGKYTDSELSEAVVVKAGTADSYLNKNITSTKYYYDLRYAPKNVRMNGNILSWDVPQITTNLTGYLVSIYTNDTGIDSYTTSSNQLSITEQMVVGNDILVIKVCAIVGGVNYETKNLFYYNPLDDNKYGVYTDTIYTFDGEVYDYYIENWTELQNLYYYAFIHRIEDLTFMVDNAFYDEYKDSYFDTSSLNNYKANDYIAGYAYYETYGFNSMPSLSMVSGLGTTNEKCFRLTCDFICTEPSYSDYGKSAPTYTQDNRYEPYYNTVDYARRSAEFNNFISDNWFLSTEVDTSEELFWAVSNHVTPIINNTESRAYLIYEKAKNILREIISDEMSDYEKALSIFDYIMTSTTYDYNSYNMSKSVNPMELMCYYLEAVFLNENKVSVCDGYSKTFALLCNMEGINCIRVVGTAGVTEKGGHAWNKVEINGNWYVVDITWTELTGNSEGLTAYRKKLALDAFGIPEYYYWEAYTTIDEEESCHAYFLISDEDIKDTHDEFDNRFIYGLLDAPISYNYYEQTYLTVGGHDYSRVIESENDLTVILDDCLKKGSKGVEVVISEELFNQAKYEGDVVEILKASRYSFCAMQFYIYQVLASEPAFNPQGITIGTETLYYIRNYLPAAFEYNSKGDVGILMIISPNVSLTTTERFNDYINFVIQNDIEIQENVTITKEKIYEWIKSITDVTTLNGYRSGMSSQEQEALITSYIDSLTDAERLNKAEEYFNAVFANNSANISVNITRTSADYTEESNTQEENGDWVTKELTMGEFTLEFNY